jgi:hypothetical protein
VVGTNGGGGEALEGVFDKLIIAAPWNTRSLHPQQQEDQVYYRSVWVAFLVTANKLDAEYFNTSSPVPDQILPIQGPDQVKDLEGIHEIACLRPIFGPDLAAESVRYLYRVLSSSPLSRFGMRTFRKAGVVEVIEKEIENAYPLLFPRPQSSTLGKFEIAGGLWHTSVAEGIASSIDWSWVVGENVGRLVGAEIELEGKRKAIQT